MLDLSQTIPHGPWLVCQAQPIIHLCQGLSRMRYVKQRAGKTELEKGPDDIRIFI